MDGQAKSCLLRTRFLIEILLRRETVSHEAITVTDTPRQVLPLPHSACTVLAAPCNDDHYSHCLIDRVLKRAAVDMSNKTH